MVVVQLDKSASLAVFSTRNAFVLMPLHCTEVHGLCNEMVLWSSNKGFTVACNYYTCSLTISVFRVSGFHDFQLPFYYISGWWVLHEIICWY